MRGAILAMIILGAGAGGAWADPDTRESEARSLALFAFDGRGWHGRAFAQLGVDEQEGTAAVGAEGRYEGARCDYLMAGGQVRMGVNDTARLALEQWASVCGQGHQCVAELFANRVEFGKHQGVQVQGCALAAVGLGFGGRQDHSHRTHDNGACPLFGHEGSSGADAYMQMRRWPKLTDCDHTHVDPVPANAAR